uniref:Uncharacterized protein n=2 Tax=Cyanoderma ruficeps TaxID=181631 RepID=A0A8C3QJK7_9PASS
MDTSTLPAVAEELLREIKKAFQETSQVPDDLLLGLKFIFGPCAVPALDLVDQRSVTRLRAPSGRTLYQFLVLWSPSTGDISFGTICPCCEPLISCIQPMASRVRGTLPCPGWALGLSAQKILVKKHQFPLLSTPSLLRSLEAQANSTPATAPATSARALPLGFLCCRRVRTFCANTSWLSTSARPWEPARNWLCLRSSSQTSSWLRKRMKDEGFGSLLAV